MKNIKMLINKKPVKRKIKYSLELKIKYPKVISKIVTPIIRAINLFSKVLFAAKTFKP